MLKAFTTVSLAMMLIGCSTKNDKQSQASKSDSTATALAERREMRAKVEQMLDSMDGKQPTATEEQADDEQSGPDALVGVYALQSNKKNNKPAVKVEKEYDDYYISFKGDSDWFPRERLRGMSVEEVEHEFGKSAHYFLEVAVTSGYGEAVLGSSHAMYKVKKGMKYNGKTFETAYVVNFMGLQQLRKL